MSEQKESRPRKLRQLLAAPGLVIGAGAHDALSARIVQRTGFPLCFVTGAGVSMSHGYADVGLLSVEEVVSTCRYIAEAVDIPVVADASTTLWIAARRTRTPAPISCGSRPGKISVTSKRWRNSFAAASRCTSTTHRAA